MRSAYYCIKKMKKEKTFYRKVALIPPFWYNTGELSLFLSYVSQKLRSSVFCFLLVFYGYHGIICSRYTRRRYYSTALYPMTRWGNGRCGDGEKFWHANSLTRKDYHIWIRPYLNRTHRCLYDAVFGSGGKYQKTKTPDVVCAHGFSVSQHSYSDVRCLWAWTK